MANHLLIGLGGTGGKVLREFRKKVYEEFRSNEPTNGTCVNYLYVDSSEDDLNSREGWKVMGPIFSHRVTSVSVDFPTNSTSTSITSATMKIPPLIQNFRKEW